MKQEYFFMTTFDIANTITWHHVDGRLDQALLDEAWAQLFHEHPDLARKYSGRWYGTVEAEEENFVVYLFDEEA